MNIKIQPNRTKNTFHNNQLGYYSTNYAKTTYINVYLNSKLIPLGTSHFCLSLILMFKYCLLILLLLINQKWIMFIVSDLMSLLVPCDFFYLTKFFFCKGLSGLVHVLFIY